MLNQNIKTVHCRHTGELSMGSWGGLKISSSASSRRIHGDCILCLICFFSLKSVLLTTDDTLVVERNLYISGHLVLQTGKATWRTGWASVIGSAGEGRVLLEERSNSIDVPSLCVRKWRVPSPPAQAQESPLHIWATLSWLLWKAEVELSSKACNYN